MNIAYILNNTYPNNGDTKAFKHMLQGLMHRGVCPFVIMPDKDGIYHDLEKQEGVSVAALNYRPATYPQLQTIKDYLLFIPKIFARIYVNKVAARKLAVYLKQKQINIVHTNVGVVDIGFFAAQKSRIPHIYHIREYGDKDFNIHYFPCKKTFLKQLSRPQSYSICITRDIQTYYRQAGEAASRVIYDGVIPKKSEMPIVSPKNYFLYAGRIEPAKGLDLLLKAYSLYLQQAANPLKLVVAGSYTDTPYANEQFNYIMKNGLTDSVSILGNRNDIAYLMAHAKAIIIPSRNEGFGFCMPEAMQQGCLVIANNTGGTKEQLDNGLREEGGEIALRYETVEQLTSLLIEVGENPVNHYMPYQERAFRVINRLYTIENNVEQVFTFYKEILQS